MALGATASAPEVTVTVTVPPEPVRFPSVTGPPEVIVMFCPLPVSVPLRCADVTLKSPAAAVRAMPLLAVSVPRAAPLGMICRPAVEVIDNVPGFTDPAISVPPFVTLDTVLICMLPVLWTVAPAPTQKKPLEPVELNVTVPVPTSNVLLVPPVNDRAEDPAVTVIPPPWETLYLPLPFNVSELDGLMITMEPPVELTVALLVMLVVVNVILPLACNSPGCCADGF